MVKRLLFKNDLYQIITKQKIEIASVTPCFIATCVLSQKFKVAFIFYGFES